MLLTFHGFSLAPTCGSGCSPDPHLVPCSPRWVHSVVWRLGERLWTWVQVLVRPLTGSVTLGKSLLPEAQFLHHQVGIIVAHTLQGSCEDSTTLQGTNYVKMLGMWQALSKWLFLSSLSYPKLTSSKYFHSPSHQHLLPWWSKLVSLLLPLSPSVCP